MARLGNVYERIDIEDHGEPKEFISALRKMNPFALFVAEEGGFPFADFVSVTGSTITIQGYRGIKQIDRIIEKAVQAKIPVVNGGVMTISDSLHGERVYCLFGINEIGEPGASATYETALHLIKESFPRTCCITYQKDAGNKAIVDAGNGISHFTLFLDGKNGRTLENTLLRLKEYDHSPEKLPDEVLHYLPNI